MAHVLELELVSGPALPRDRWRVVDGFRIGRAETCQLELAEPSVSRQHAVIASDGSGWTLRDCRSHLGTLLNELPLAPDTPAALHPGDVIAIGPWRFRIAALAPGIAAAEADHAHVDVVGQLGSLAEQRLELLLRCAGEVAAAADEQALADALAEHALLGSGYTRAAVLWRGGTELALRSLRPVAGANEMAFRFSRSLIASAEGGEVVRIDASTDAALGSDRAQRPIRRALCAPLLLDGRAAAFLYLDSNRAARRGHTDAPTFVQALARLAALALSNLRRLDSERGRAILAADIERAREVQRRLLPDDRAPIGGVRHALHMHPGRSVAGDIADVVALPDGSVAALLGDVSGAGLGAGLVMASVQSFLRAELAHHSDPARALERLNRHLHAQASSGRFVTLWLGIFEPASRRCRFVDAGHGHALRLRAGHPPEAIRARGDIPLGIDADVAFHAETLDLGADEIVLLYSDGVIEQRAPEGAAFGRERLIDAVRGAATPALAMEAALDALTTHAANTPPDDDTTLLAVGWPA
ncbi:MAG: SpoIIE family protein phosphatase [Dokdonella sp.]